MNNSTQYGNNGNKQQMGEVKDSRDWGVSENFTNDSMWGEMGQDIFGAFESSYMEEGSGTAAVVLAQKALQAVHGIQATANKDDGVVQNDDKAPCWNFGPVPNPTLLRQTSQDDWNFVSQLGGTALKRPKVEMQSKIVQEETIFNLPGDHYEEKEHDEKKKERESMCRDRNREYARNTRIRKKAYVRQLEETVKKMRDERDLLIQDEEKYEKIRISRRQCLETFLDYRARGEVSEDAWANLVDPQKFELWLPVTPYRSYNPTEVLPSEAGAFVADRRVCRGVHGLVFDTASFAVMLQSIGVPRRRGHKLVACSLELVDPLGLPSDSFTKKNDDLMIDKRDPARVMGAWRMRTRNAVDCGAASECDQRGFLIAAFDKQNRLKRLDLCFDALGFLRQLQRARGVPWLEVVPNTLQAALKDLAADDASYTAAYAQRLESISSSCGRGSKNNHASLSNKNQSLGPNGRHIAISSLTRYGHFARPKVVTIADRPHLITHVNRDFLDLAGLEANEAIGRSLRIIQGPATDTAVVEDMLADVARRIPTSMIVINYTKSMERFINYLRVFPLFDPSSGIVTHYFGELERVDDDTVCKIEHNSPMHTPVWRLENIAMPGPYIAPSIFLPTPQQNQFHSSSADRAKESRDSLPDQQMHPMSAPRRFDLPPPVYDGTRPNYHNISTATMQQQRPRPSDILLEEKEIQDSFSTINNNMQLS